MENEIKGLYKGRYLIALYGKDDELLLVADNIGEFTEQMKRFSKAHTDQYSHMNKILNNGVKKSRIKLIDVFESADDCFKEEDKEFLDFLRTEVEPKHNKVGTYEALAKQMGISTRTFYRRGLNKEAQKQQERGLGL